MWEELESKQHELTIQHAHCEELQTQNKDFDEENIWLREMLNKNIITFDDNSTYTTDLQKCVFELLGYNVSFQNVSPVICKKVQVGKDQEKAQSEKDSHSKNRGGKNQTNNQVLIP